MQSSCEIFYIFVDSSDCSTTFTDNSTTNFKIQLNRQISLNSEWKVALAELTYPSTLFTFDQPQKVTAYSKEANSFQTSFAIPADYYDSLETLISTINETVEKHVKITSVPRIELKDENKVKLNSGSIRNSSGVSPVFLKFSETLHNILGIERWGRAFLNSKQNNLFVYCSIVANRHVGDSYTPLLRQFTLSKDSGYNLNVNRLFRRFHFCKLAISNFNVLEFQIYDDTGKRPRFKIGDIRLVLCFKRGNHNE